MKTSKQTWLGRLIPSTILLFIVSGCATNKGVIVDSLTEITILTNSGPVTVLAKIDTGARSSSIDKSFVEKYGLESLVENTGDDKCLYGEAYITNAHGGQCRPRVKLPFIMRGDYHENPATVSDRRHLQTVVLIGRRDTIGKYLVRPISHKGVPDDAEAEAEEDKE